MAYDDIVRSVAKIKAKCGETDPFALCSLLGIPVCYSPMGKGKDAIKGFFVKSNRIKVILYLYTSWRSESTNAEAGTVMQNSIMAQSAAHAIYLTVFFIINLPPLFVNVRLGLSFPRRSRFKAPPGSVPFGPFHVTYLVGLSFSGIIPLSFISAILHLR